MGIGCGGLLVILLLTFVFGGDPAQILQLLGGLESVSVDQPGPGGGGVPGAPSDELGQFAAVVLADTEDTWNELLGERYHEPTLVLFSGAVQSACGFNSAAVGPFYCPPDERLYIDLSFFDDLHQRFAAPGDFAQAYVIAHEVAHHVQNVLGISREVRRLQQAAGSQEEVNQLSVRLELQADCLAGVWGHYARQRGLLEPGDLEEGLAAAAAIGDDRIQRRTQGHVVPESFTHGSSRQRVEWFSRGFESGAPDACSTFG